MDRFLHERGAALSDRDRAWLAAQRAAWLSVWEVTDVEPGAGLTLRDLLSHETRRVREATASRTLVARDAILTRVVDHGGVSLLCGVHPRSLPPFGAADVVRRARKRLRLQRAVPPEKLRAEGFGRHLIRSWEEAVAELDSRPSTPLDLRNGDGHRFLLTTDHFDVVPDAVRAVTVKLADLDGVRRSDENDAADVYEFIRATNPMSRGMGNTLIGRASIAGRTLRIETNSRERADDLRATVEAACGELIRHRAREHADPLSTKADSTPGSGQPEPEPSPEILAAIRDTRTRHYAGWIDQTLPALGGKSPREAVRTPAGRAAVDVLLKDMENREQRLGAGRFDFSGIRRRLGLE